MNRGCPESHRRSLASLRDDMRWSSCHSCFTGACAVPPLGMTAIFRVIDCSTGACAIPSLGNDVRQLIIQIQHSTFNTNSTFKTQPPSVTSCPRSLYTFPLPPGRLDHDFATTSRLDPREEAQPPRSARNEVAAAREVAALRVRVAGLPEPHANASRRGTATFMILGDICTRSCGFCNVTTGRPYAPPSPDEPRSVAEAAKRMGLRHVVVTCVTRDDLADGGARSSPRRSHACARRCPDAAVEVLTSDFRGNFDSVRTVVEAQPDYFNHNVETVPRLYDFVRPGSRFERSLAVLREAKRARSDVVTKSGLMLGLGETARRKSIDVLRRLLRDRACEIVTIGQYLQPKREKLDVVEYIAPDVFDEYRSHRRRDRIPRRFLRSVRAQLVHGGRGRRQTQPELNRAIILISRTLDAPRRRSDPEKKENGAVLPHLAADLSRLPRGRKRAGEELAVARIRPICGTSGIGWTIRSRRARSACSGFTSSATFSRCVAPASPRARWRARWRRSAGCSGFSSPRRHLKHDPTENLENPKLWSTLPKSLQLIGSRSAAAPRRIARTADGLRDAAMLELLYATGLRVSRADPRQDRGPGDGRRLPAHDRQGIEGAHRSVRRQRARRDRRLHRARTAEVRQARRSASLSLATAAGR